MTTEMTATRVRALFAYDCASGLLRWKVRPASDFSSVRAAKIWNARFAGRIAGSTDVHGYREIGVDNRAFKAHRLAWLWVTGDWPCGDIDHLDGNRLNNQFSNLRDVARRVNCENRRSVRSDSGTGLLGVHFHKASQLFHACIKAQGTKHSLGYFKTAEAAHAAYVNAKRQLHEGCTI